MIDPSQMIDQCFDFLRPRKSIANLRPAMQFGRRPPYAGHVPNVLVRLLASANTPLKGIPPVVVICVRLITAQICKHSF